LTTCNDDGDDDSQDRPTPTVLFTAADNSQEKTDDQSSPKIEASPMVSGVTESSWSVFSSFWSVITLSLHCWVDCSLEFVLEQWNLQIHPLLSEEMSSISSIRRIYAAFSHFKSIAGGPVSHSLLDSTVQAVFSIHRRFIHTIWCNDSCIHHVRCRHFAVWRSFAAQAASIGPRRNINATKSLLTFDRISPFVSEQAAESLLKYNFLSVNAVDPTICAGTAHSASKRHAALRALLGLLVNRIDFPEITLQYKKIEG
jgi:hypothetical protein